MDFSASSETRNSESTSHAIPVIPKFRSTSLLIILGLWVAVYFAGIFTPALLDDVDTIHAEAAREIVLRHDWVTLHTNGIRYLEKAPLMYWAVAVSYKLFGVSEWATRLPLMLTVLGLLMAVYALGKHCYGEAAGLYSAVVLCTCIGPYIFTRFQIPDVVVALWLTLSFYFFLRSLEEERPSRLNCWGFAGVCGLNVLTKGLIGLVFPAAAIGLYLVLTGKLRQLLKLRLFSSTLVFLAIAAPWHILAAIRNPDQGIVRGFLWFYFVNEHFLRYLNQRVPPGYDTVPLLIFWALLLLWLMPWGIFLPQALKAVPWKWRDLRNEPPPAQRATLLFVLWVLVVVGFFSFSTRQEYYTIPAVPAMALLVGGWLAKESAKTDPEELHAGRISSLVLLIIVAAGSILGLAILFSSHPPGPSADLADLLSKNPEDYDFSLGHFLDLTPEALGIFRMPLLGAVVSLLVGSALNWSLRRRGHPSLGNWVLAVMMLGLLTCVHSALSTFSPILSSKELALAVRRYYQPGDLIVVDGQYHEASSLNFYTTVPLRVLHEPSGNLWYGSKFPDAPHVFETEASFAALWEGRNTVFLWSEEQTPKVLRDRHHYVLLRSGGKFIFTNRELRQ